MKFRNFLIILLCLLLCLKIFSQNVGIGTNSPAPSAMLEISATDKGLLIPRMSKANRPTNPINSIIIYQTDSISGFYYYQDGKWSRIQDATYDTKFNSFGPDTTVTFNHTGSLQTWVVPNGVNWVKVNCQGAEGATGVFHTPNVSITFNPGGKGGKSEGILKVTPGETLYVYVGGFVASPTTGTNGQLIQGGWNGGGDAIVDVTLNTQSIPGAGGGASDIRQGGNSLAHRKIIAGGGGGGGTDLNIDGGYGGGLSGGPGYCFISGSCAQGGTQNNGFALGDGMDATAPFRGAGGGGYYGGFASAVNIGAGGGGSGFIDVSVRQGTSFSNIRSGHGVISIIYNRNTSLDTITTFPYPLSADVVSDAINLSNYGNKAVLYSHNDSIKGNDQQLVFDPSSNRLGIGTNLPTAKLEVKGLNGTKLSSTNPGTGTTDWIAASGGGTSGDRIVMGTFNGSATLGAHNSTLTAWDTLVLNPGGKIKIPSLANPTKRLLMIDQNGILKDTNMVTYGNGIVLSNNQVQLGGAIQSPAQLNLNGQNFQFNNNFQNGVFVDIPWDTPWATDAIPIGQTFNLPVGGTLTGIRIFPGNFVNNNTCTWSMYQGSSTNGTLLATGNVTINAPDILIPLNINFAANTTYYIHLLNSRNRINFSNPFPYGTSILTSTGAPILSDDLVLQLLGNVNVGSAFTIKSGGYGTGPASTTVNISGLGGSGTRLVNVNSTGDLSTQTISSVQDNLGNHSASQALLLNNNIIQNSLSSTEGIKIDNNGKVGIGVSTPDKRLDVSGLGGLRVNSSNPGSGTTDWIAGNFGGTFGDRIVMGNLNGLASIGAHNNALSSYSSLSINAGGPIYMPNLTQSSTRFLTIDNTGLLGSSTVLQNASSIATGLLTNGDWNIFNNKQNALANANSSTNGILTATDWNTFNNKQNALGNANGSTNGILTAGDWNTFNNKQNALTNASGSTNGILTASDWNTFNNKYNLPGLTNGSIVYYDGSNLTENNSQLQFNPTTQFVGIGTSSPNSKLDVNGEKGLEVNSTNNGNGTTDWIASNVGGSSGDRVVSGVLNGTATIGAHNNALNAWDTLAINPDAVGTSIVLGGDKSKTSPISYAPNTGAPRPVAVNGSIRQSYYSSPVNIGPNGEQEISWTHNFGYGPIVMMSTDANGQGGDYNIINVSYTTYNTNNNVTVFKLKNNSAATAMGTFRWIVVW
jgi:hypothetical protein